MEYLLRKIPADQMAAKASDDRAFIEEIAEIWGEAGHGNAVTPDTLQALLILMLTLIMQTKMIPTAEMKTATKLLRQTFVDRMTRRTLSSAPARQESVIP